MIEKGKNWIFYPNPKARRCSSTHAIRQALIQLAKRQEESEGKYLNAILGFNDLSKHFSKPSSKKTPLRIRDLIYDYWEEEDLRINLSEELHRFPFWIHGQTHFVSKKKKRRERKQRRLHAYPDLLLVDKKNHLECTAIELKFYLTSVDTLKKDLRKLVRYQRRKRANFNANCGYVVCYDESGKAEELLEKLLNKPMYKNYALGYGIIKSSWAGFRSLLDPWRIERRNTDFDEKQIDYFAGLFELNLIRGGLIEKSPLNQDRADDTKYFYIKDKLLRWAGVMPPGSFEQSHGKFGVFVGFQQKNSLFAKKVRLKPYKWNWQAHKSLISDKESRDNLIYNFSKEALSSKERIEKEARKAARAIKRIYDKFEEMK